MADPTPAGWYRQKQRFADNKGTVHGVGSIVYFEEGKAPRNSVPLTAAEAKAHEASIKREEAKNPPRKKSKKKPETLSELQKDSSQSELTL